MSTLKRRTPPAPTFGLRLLPETQAQLRVVRILARLSGDRLTTDRLLRRLLNGAGVQYRRRLRQAGVDYESALDGVSTRSKAGFKGLPAKLPPVVRKYEE